MKKVLRMTDAEIDQMRDEIKTEAERDPMDGGIVIPQGGDGIQRIPTDATGMPTDPTMSAQDRAGLAVGIPPDYMNPDAGAEAPPEEPEPTEDEFDKSLTVKGKKK